VNEYDFNIFVKMWTDMSGSDLCGWAASWVLLCNCIKLPEDGRRSNSDMVVNRRHYTIAGYLWSSVSTIVGGWIILGWILERRDGVMWAGLVWLRIGTGGELL
jgi:hypothetical protein